MLTSQDATVHVDVSFHPIVPGDHRYVYHDHRAKKFYGVYNPIDQKIHYEYVDTEFVCEFEARVTSKGRNSGLYNHTKFAAGHEPRWSMRVPHSTIIVLHCFALLSFEI